MILKSDIYKIIGDVIVVVVVVIIIVVFVVVVYDVLSKAVCC